MTSENVKIVTVGDGAVGKTCMMTSYTENAFPEDYVPTVFENYTANVMVDDKIVEVSLWDTAGQEEYQRLRPLSYNGTDVYLVCFSIANRDSFNNIASMWMPELHRFSKDAGYLLVGTKSDLRQEEIKTQLISKKEAETLAQQVGADGFVECSALTQDGLKAAFDEAIRIGLRKRLEMQNRRQHRRKMFSKRCTIM